MRLPVQEPTLAICKLLVRSSSSLYTSNKEDGKTPPCLTSLRMSKHQNSILTHRMLPDCKYIKSTDVATSKPNVTFYKTSWVHCIDRAGLHHHYHHYLYCLLIVLWFTNKIYIAAQKLQIHLWKAGMYLAASVLVSVSISLCICVSVCQSVRTTTEKPLYYKSYLSECSHLIGL